jgi:hypothetical protein
MHRDKPAPWDERVEPRHAELVEAEGSGPAASLLR